MKKVVGIIAEYNPFHSGHGWHAERAREGGGAVVAVMSGSFVQRGETAVFDKWSRAAMAVKGGVDLVLELPFVFAVRSAEYFAAGGIRLLGELGIVNQVAFGAENADLELLGLAASKIDCPETLRIFHQKLKTGKTYAAALTEAAALNSQLPPEFLSAPNNILAIEYLRAIKKYAPHLTPVAVARHGAGHHEQAISGKMTSASAIRQAFLGKVEFDKIEHFLPEVNRADVESLLAQGRLADYRELGNIILAKLRLKNFDELDKLPEVAEGLNFKVAKAAQRAVSLEELLTLLKSKRYTHTRLKRITAHALLDTAAKDIKFFDQSGPLYARVLAFNQTGRKLLREINLVSQVPVITKTASYLTSKEMRVGNLSPAQTMLSYDILSTDIHALSIASPQFKTGGQDFLKSPEYLQ